MNVEPKSFEDALDTVDRELNDLMIRKQMDYGHGNITAFGEIGILVRCSDKLARLKNLIMTGRKPSNESVDDSWRDLANYGKIALMYRRGIFILPLKRDADLPPTPLEVI